jgi:hypothetical protein
MCYEAGFQAAAVRYMSVCPGLRAAVRPTDRARTGTDVTGGSGTLTVFPGIWALICHFRMPAHCRQCCLLRRAGLGVMGQMGKVGGLHGLCLRVPRPGMPCSWQMEIRPGRR